MLRGTGQVCPTVLSVLIAYGMDVGRQSSPTQALAEVVTVLEAEVNAHKSL